jgi:hypothetical protein
MTTTEIVNIIEALPAPSKNMAYLVRVEWIDVMDIWQGISLIAERRGYKIEYKEYDGGEIAYSHIRITPML